MHSHGFKVVVIGDACIGKTSLVRRFVYGDFSPQCVPTARDDYMIRRRVSEGSSSASQRISFDIVDTGGQGALDRLRPLCYSNADVIILCFSVVNPSSFKNITDKWIPEIQRHAQNNASFLLVGTQADLRSNLNVLIKLSENGLAPLPESRAIRLAHKIGAIGYIETSAVTAKNVNEVFNLSFILSVQQYEESLVETRPPPEFSDEMVQGHHYQKPPKQQQQPPRPTMKRCPGKDGESYTSLTSAKKKNVNGGTNGNKKNNFSSGQGGGGGGGGGGVAGAVASKLFSRQWRHKKGLKLKRLLFLSCLPH